ncbi:MAG TPA: sulfur carrier protein ThiS [Solirubrobacteraceae bacterium]|nr:sulfur carrier protein ThiS [Solirubrobacteraceae bacterium]
MIWLNGRELDGCDGVTVAELLAELGVEPAARGVAVAVDGEVVPRGEWTRRAVAAGARVEALTAMQGG